MIDKIGLLRWVRARVNHLFDIANAQLRLTETGGSITADGTEQTVAIIDVPTGSFKPLKMKIDMTNMDWGDSTVVKWYERLVDGGGLVEKDEERFDGPQNIMPLSPVKNIELEPNRFGIRVSLQQVAGTNRAYPWEFLADE